VYSVTIVQLYIGKFNSIVLFYSVVCIWTMWSWMVVDWWILEDFEASYLGQIEVFSRNFLWGTQETHKMSKSGYLVSQPRWEPNVIAKSNCAV
jgi:hypothetical protein